MLYAHPVNPIAKLAAKLATWLLRQKLATKCADRAHHEEAASTSIALARAHASAATQLAHEIRDIEAELAIREIAS